VRGSCTCSYLLPVINHYLLYFGLARCQRAEGLYRVPTHPFWHRNGGPLCLQQCFQDGFRKCRFQGCVCAFVKGLMSCVTNVTTHAKTAAAASALKKHCRYSSTAVRALS